MKIIEFDSKELIKFYSENELEFSEEQSYFGNNQRSFVIIDGQEVLGAVTISKYKLKSYIEAIAVKKEYRKNGYGTILLDKAIKELDGDVYVISKEHDFYLQNGFEFIEDTENMISDNCKKCEEYNNICFPKVFIKYKKN